MASTTSTVSVGRTAAAISTTSHHLRVDVEAAGGVEEYEVRPATRAWATPWRQRSGGRRPSFA
jgi:hypothetical protein